MKSREFLLFAAIFLTASMLGISLPIQAQSAVLKSEPAHYVLTDLGPVGASTGPLHLTNNGLISGASSHKGAEQAALWYDGWKFDIGTPGLGGANNVSFGVNGWAQAVGEADTAEKDPNGEDFCGFAASGFTSGTTCLPFAWQDGVMTAMPTLAGKNGKRGPNGTANVINDWGQVAGLSETTTVDSTCPAYDPSNGQRQKLQTKPVAWLFGEVQELPTLGDDPDGAALAINDQGSIAGTSGTCSPFNPTTLLNIQPVHAILWKDGNAIDLKSLGGKTGNIALGINDRDDVVGGSDVTGDTTSHGFLWTRETETMQDLLPFGEDVFSTAIAVNHDRTVVGVSINAQGNLRAALWQDGEPFDLNSRISASSSLYLLLACSINSRGEIVGLAVDTKTGAAHGYLATPVDGPGR
jgi:probable HAF family extracellular repeat protein